MPKRNFYKCNNADLDQTDWARVLSGCITANDQWESFLEELNNLLNAHCPTCIPNFDRVRKPFHYSAENKRLQTRKNGFGVASRLAETMNILVRNIKQPPNVIIRQLMNFTSSANQKF